MNALGKDGALHPGFLELYVVGLSKTRGLLILLRFRGPDRRAARHLPE